MREVFTNQDFTLVGYYKSVLDEAGISTFMRNENSGYPGASGAIFFPTLCVVNDADYDKAIRILKSRQANEASGGEEWTCPSCLEKNPASFELCWKCNTSKKAQPNEEPINQAENSTEARHDALIVGWEQVTQPKNSAGGRWAALAVFAMVVVPWALVMTGMAPQADFQDGYKAYEMGNYDLAITDYSWGIWLGSESARAYGNRGMFYAARWKKNKTATDYDQAIRDFSKAIELDPDDANAYSNRGDIYASKGNYDQALRDLGQAIRINPNDALLYCNRGITYLRKDEDDKAILDFTEAIQLDPLSEPAYFGRGIAHQHKDEYSEAIEDYNRALFLNSKDEPVYSHRGRAYADKGEYDKAIANCDQAIQLDPKFAGNYSNRAWFLATCPQANLRDGKKAMGDAITACVLSEWKDPAAVDALAAAYGEVGDFDNAVKYERNYLESPNEKTSDIAEAKKRLVLYQAHKPYHADK